MTKRCPWISKVSQLGNNDPPSPPNS